MRTKVIQVRLTPKEKEVIKAAAGVTESTLSDFMRRSALAMASEALKEDRDSNISTASVFATLLAPLELEP